MQKRVFIALALDEMTQKHIHTKMEPLMENLDAKWTRPEDLHLPISSLGMVDDDFIIEVCDLLTEGLKGVIAFDLRLDQLVWGPNAENPKMIWVKGEENKELINLRNLVESTISEDAKEIKTFMPHLTLAKVPKKSFSKEIDLSKIQMHLSLPFDKVDVMEVFSEGRQRFYRVLQSIPLDF